jgi:hypothetical protein
MAATARDAEMGRTMARGGMRRWGGRRRPRAAPGEEFFLELCGWRSCAGGGDGAVCGVRCGAGADARKKTYKRRGVAVPNWMTTITFRFFEL